MARDKRYKTKKSYFTISQFHSRPRCEGMQDSADAT